MNPKNNTENLAARLATFSVLTGGASVQLCISPLFQFPLAMAGLTLALLSRVQNEKKFSGPAMTGLILSIAGIVISLFTFAMAMLVYNVILPHPVLGKDYMELYRQFFDGVGGIPSL